MCSCLQSIRLENVRSCHSNYCRVIKQIAITCAASFVLLYLLFFIFVVLNRLLRRIVFRHVASVTLSPLLRLLFIIGLSFIFTFYYSFHSNCFPSLLLTKSRISSGFVVLTAPPTPPPLPSRHNNLFQPIP